MTTSELALVWRGLRRADLLSGDTRLPPLQKVAWLIGNSLRALRGEVDPRRRRAVQVIAPTKLRPGLLEYSDETGRATLASSPGRLLAVDTTMRALELVEARVEGGLSVLDIGCGSGMYYPFFRARLHRFEDYVGVDVRSHHSWRRLSAAGSATFVESSAETFVADLDPSAPFNFVYSNSALEHIRRDKDVIAGLCRWVRTTGRPVAQLHVIPATAALPLYRTHGFRVYSRAAVAELLPFFWPAEVSVIGLGGRRSWVLHATRVQTRAAHPARYARELLKACSHDVERGGRHFPILWALLALPPRGG